MRTFPIFWLTGNSGAGKSTLAHRLKDSVDADSAHPLHRKIIVLDGDVMRRSISADLSFSPEDRRTHNLRVARLAHELRAQGFCVLVAVIAPFRAVRKEIDAVCAPRWIHVHREGLGAPDRPYEPPESPACTLRTDEHDADRCFQELLTFVESVLSAS